ncbi:2-hydroxychromene-2-carboxylate isomerase [Actibacterium sp. XHP0104]|uniref:2-hydroxychromene-2-carboxylate isomerase n=1 Tax=Actibacterium sp. XHP0104 TaxID=2984335 RepID=UPI0021E884A7|nr:2-hydroxychromene-2-carboxylate isomerase [Actibacterium sp. XHP0104]MCV2882665.1 2-hydroxychromene-2-carboxylate isomerase [Actibacterium sp. XHP0104]
MAPPTLDFWFEFASTYSYLSAMRIDDIAAQHGVAVRWRPFLLGPIFAAQGWDTSPFNIYPAKGRYMWRDMERICAERGLAFARPDPFPQNGLMAARIALAAGTAMPAFCHAVYQAQFAQGADISDTAVLADCLTTAGLPHDLIQRAGTPEVKTALRAQTEEAMRIGLFGAPSFVSGAEVFWGDDRLEQAMAWALRQNTLE